MKTQLVIMAAGIGSRYKGGIKQIEKLGPKGEIIIDYSISSAIQAGFDEIVFIIRKEIEKDFKEVIGNRIEKYISCKYAYQELEKLPKGFELPKDRIKPYGTGHAILCAKEEIDSPFLVINADDYYGDEGFKKIHEYLINNNTKKDYMDLCMAGFIIHNTLSDKGSVTRGICEKNQNDEVISIRETYEISKKGDKIIGYDENNNEIIIDNDAVCSMNMWGLPVEFLDILEDQFTDFLKQNNQNIKSEYLLPKAVDLLIKENKAKVKILPVNDKWFGVTYHEDADIVREAFLKIGPAKY